jgi:hypothetical protein
VTHRTTGLLLDSFGCPFFFSFPWFLSLLCFVYAKSRNEKWIAYRGIWYRVDFRQGLACVS